MDEFLASSLPWEIKAAVCLACGLVTAVLVIAIPKRTLAWIGKKKLISLKFIVRLHRLSIWLGVRIYSLSHFWGFKFVVFAERILTWIKENNSITPNTITWARLPIFWAGVWAHFYLSPFWGFELVVLSCALDRLDGKMAMAFVEFGIFRSLASKKLGELLDPLIDKATLLPLIAIFAYQDIIIYWIAIAIIFVDVLGTLLRKAVILWFKKSIEPRIGKFLDTRVFKIVKNNRRALGKRMRLSKSSAAGKIKALLQSLALVACMPYEMNWLKNPTVPNIMFDLALFFGVLSVVSRVKIHEDVDKVVDSANSVFSHQDI